MVVIISGRFLGFSDIMEKSKPKKDIKAKERGIGVAVIDRK